MGGVEHFFFQEASQCWNRRVLAVDIHTEKKVKGIRLSTALHVNYHGDGVRKMSLDINVLIYGKHLHNI